MSTVKLGAARWSIRCGAPAWSFALIPPACSVLGAAVAIASPFAALTWLDRWNQRTPEPTAEVLARLARLRAAACAAIAEARARPPS